VTDAMHAAVLTDAGLAVREIPRPRPKPNEVLVRVRAAGLNRADLIMLGGARHGSAGGPGTVLGLEFAGEVAEAGSQVRELKAGDRVMCSGSGGYAQFAVADWGRCTPLPAGMRWETAASLPVALQTMHDALVTNGRLQTGESVLIQGASSGVGLMALQIAKLKGAGLVIGSSTNAARRVRLKEFGADLAVDSSDPGWPDSVLAATEGKGVHLIIDQISATVANANMKAAAVRGRIVNVGRLGGNKGEFDFDLHALKRIDYIGVTFRTRSIEEIREINARMRADLMPAVAAGKLGVPIDRVLPLAEAADALAHMRTNAHLGKIVLSV